MAFYFGENTDEDRFLRLENNCADIRKTLMGALLLAKDLYGNELRKSREGEEVIRVLESAEDAFVDSSLTNILARLENVIDVIQRRVHGVYILMEYLSDRKKV